MSDDLEKEADLAYKNCVCGIIAIVVLLGPASAEY